MPPETLKCAEFNDRIVAIFLGRQRTAQQWRGCARRADVERRGDFSAIRVVGDKCEDFDERGSAFEKYSAENGCNGCSTIKRLRALAIAVRERWPEALAKASPK